MDIWISVWKYIFIYIKIQFCTFCGCNVNFKVSQLIILLITALRASYILYNHFVSLLRSKSHSNPKYQHIGGGTFFTVALSCCFGQSKRCSVRANQRVSLKHHFERYLTCSVTTLTCSDGWSWFFLSKKYSILDTSLVMYLNIKFLEMVQSSILKYLPMNGLGFVRSWISVVPWNL